MNLHPFTFQQFPHQHTRYNTVICSPEANNETKSFLQFILNSHLQKSIYNKSTKPSEHPFADLLAVDRDGAKAPAQSVLFIVDISSSNTFKNIHPDVQHIPIDNITPAEHMNMVKLLVDVNCNGKKVYTIWLADDINAVPRVVQTSANLLSIMDNKMSMKKFNCTLHQDFILIKALGSCPPMTESHMFYVFDRKRLL